MGWFQLNNNKMRLLIPKVAVFSAIFATLSIYLCPFGYAAEDNSLGLPPVGRRKTDEKAVDLGKKLFFDARLSADKKVSCATCHVPELAFSDGLQHGQGVLGRLGTRNTPSLLNVAVNSAFFWDGRRTSMNDQARDPFVNVNEHGLQNHDVLLAVLKNDSTYVAHFRNAFQVNRSQISLDHVGRAIAAYERTLIAGNSAFDRFEFGGDPSAMTASAVRGKLLFEGRAQCVSCHSIEKKFATFSDGKFHALNVGMSKISSNLAELTSKFVSLRSQGSTLDEVLLSQPEFAELGRFAVTKDPADIGKFRTPSLRNVSLTAPYMHDGSVATLQEAIELEVYYRSVDGGKALILTPAEKQEILDFLESLSSRNVEGFSDSKLAHSKKR